jgi:phytoene synthase
MPSSIRPAFAALWALDLAFADVVATSTDPRLGAIRLAWWRERLEQLDQGAAAPSEPRLQQVAADLLPRGVSGAELSQLEDVWAPMLDAFPWGAAQIDGFRQRGRLLFGISARLLGSATVEAEKAGELWSLHDGAAHCSDPSSRNLLDEAAIETVRDLPGKMPPRLRPLTVIAALAAAGGKRRGPVALAHRLFGTFPR